jgi:hypothetical protein
MTPGGWAIVEVSSRLLESGEREVVLGDLFEANEGTGRALLDILGLFLRRQAALWKGWQPWLAAVVIAPSMGYLLVTVSLSVSCTFQRLVFHKVFTKWYPTGHEGYFLLLCHVFLLVAWSWAGGYIVGWISRGTVCVSAVAALFPAFWGHDVIGVLKEPSLFLFTLPAIWGIHCGLKRMPISLWFASALAVAVTVIMIVAWNSQALWIRNWWLIWPGWFLVLVAWNLDAKKNRPVDSATSATAS